MESTPTSKSDGFRISLKWMLVGFVVLGAGSGLLAKAFLQNPNVFRLAMLVLSTIVPFALAIGTLLRLGIRSRRKPLVVWAALLGVAPFIGFTLLFVASTFIKPSPGGMGASGLGAVANQQLINQRLPLQIDSPWVWNELTRRLQSNSLSQAEVDSAVRKLVTHMKTTKPQGWDSPLPWQRDFLKAASFSQPISEAVLFDLCDAYYGPTPRIERVPRLREGQSRLQLSIGFGTVWGDHVDLPVRLIWSVERVLIDGESVPFTKSHSFENQWSGYCSIDLPAGDHNLKIEVACAYVDKNQLIDLKSGAIDSSAWPNQLLKVWEKTVTASFEVFTKEAQIIRLSTDPKDNPMASRAIRIQRLVIQSAENQKSKVLLLIQCNDILPVPLSFDVSATLNDQTISMGSFYAAQIEGHRIYSEKKLSQTVERIDPAITTADVVFTPNPVPFESNPEIDRIWGKPIRFYDVPIERFDLKSTKGPADSGTP